MSHSFRAGLLALSLLAAPIAAPAQAPPAAPADQQVLARVNGKPITLADVAEATEALPPEYRGMPPAVLTPLLLDQLISRRVVADAARAAGIAETEAYRRRMAKAEEDALTQTFISGKLDSLLTDAALRARYRAEVVDKPAAFRVCARHILVASAADATAAIDELAKGGDFAAIARARSSDGSRARGGDLGCFSKEEMVAPFAEAAFALAPGQTSASPVETQFGWHVIRVDRREEQPKPTFEEALPQLRREMAEAAVNSLIEQLRGQATIERLDLPPRPALDATPPAPARRQ